jgi:hypothetical protein
MYAGTYVFPSSAERVCVNRRKVGVPVFKQPLVVHPATRGTAAWPRLVALLGDPNAAYKNADLHGFPVSPTGQSKTGVAFDVPDREVLRQAVECLGGKPAMQSLLWRAAEGEVEAEYAGRGLSETEKHRMVATRLCQGAFRSDLVELWQGACALTGCEVAEALTASHIQAWSLSNHEQRQDPYNGLLLVASADRLFDRGLISFDDDGVMLSKSTLTVAELERLGLSNCNRLRKIDRRHLPYLRAHRRLHSFE